MLYIPANRIAICIGLFALIPFIVLAACLWFVLPVWQARFAEALLGWGAVMLAFTGAVHWGAALKTGDEPVLLWQYIYGFCPPVLAWVILMCEPGQGYFLLFIGMIAGFMVDRRVMAGWYVTLRAVLTMVACASLYAAYKALV